MALQSIKRASKYFAISTAYIAAFTETSEKSVATTIVFIPFCFKTKVDRFVLAFYDNGHQKN
jgi:hypothetical protein